MHFLNDMIPVAKYLVTGISIMFERSLYEYVRVDSAPFGFLLAHRFTGERLNPLPIALSQETKIIYDPLCKMYLLEGKKLPWFVPIPAKHVHNFAKTLGVQITGYEFP